MSYLQAKSVNLLSSVFDLVSHVITPLFELVHKSTNLVTKVTGLSSLYIH